MFDRKIRCAEIPNSIASGGQHDPSPAHRRVHALAMTLLGAPSAMAYGGGSPAGSAAATSCTGVLTAAVGPTAVTVTGTVRCAADAVLDLTQDRWCSSTGRRW